MNNPGIWILGATEPPSAAPASASSSSTKASTPSPNGPDPSERTQIRRDYSPFGRNLRRASPAATPDQIIEMVFEKIPGGAGQFNNFTVNGKPYPHENEFVLKQGHRYRLVFRNRTDDAHPLHLHRHQIELVDNDGTPTSGVIKDTVVVPFYGRATVDFTANQPGLTLFHCHIQAHMDYGFKALFRYA